MGHTRKTDKIPFPNPNPSPSSPTPRAPTKTNPNLPQFFLLRPAPHRGPDFPGTSPHTGPSSFASPGPHQSQPLSRVPSHVSLPDAGTGSRAGAAAARPSEPLSPSARRSRPAFRGGQVCARQPFQRGTPPARRDRASPAQVSGRKPTRAGPRPTASCGRGLRGHRAHLVERLHHLHQHPLLRSGRHPQPRRLPSGRR